MFTCPKCGGIMHGECIAVIPPIIYWECSKCGFKSKGVTEFSGNDILPKDLWPDDLKESKDA